MTRLWFVLVLLLMVGCTGVSLQIPTLNPTLTPTVTVTAPPPATETPDTASVLCAYVWSNRSLPELSREVASAFRDRGMTEIEVDASAYGEDCIDSVTNEVVRFSAVQTDFYFGVPVPDMTDSQQMGEWIEKIYQVMEEFPPGGEIPGPNPGYFGITFGSGSETINLWFPRTEGQRLLEEGLQGTSLYDALRPAP